MVTKIHSPGINFFHYSVSSATFLGFISFGANYYGVIHSFTYSVIFKFIH